MQPIFDFLISMQAIQWLSLGVALLSLELMFPGVFMLWFGLAALVMALVVWPTGISGAIPLVMFLILSVAFSYLGKKWQSKRNNQPQNVNNLKSKFIGREFLLDQPITGGQGRTTIDGTSWVLIGSDAPKGTKLKIVRLNGNSLVVEPA